jgi:hypothetical protein
MKLVKMTPVERKRERRKLDAGGRISEYRTAAEEVRQLRTAMEQGRDFAIAAMCDANTRALQLGTKLIEWQERFQGDFDEWLENYCEEFFSRASAYRWIAKVRVLRLVLGKEKPTFEELKSALIASEVLPEPRPEHSASALPPPLFRLKLDVNGPPPEEWAPVDRKEFLERAKPIVDLYERVRAAEEAA